MYERLKKLYENKQLSIKGLENAVHKGWITVDQQKTICKEVS